MTCANCGAEIEYINFPKSQFWVHESHHQRECVPQAIESSLAVPEHDVFQD